MLKKIARLSLIGLLMPLLALADGASSLKDFYGKTQSLRANFHQIVTDKQGRKVQEVQGQMQLLRPDKFRWDYLAPFEQQIVSDGKQVWLYDVDLAQVTVRAVTKALGASPAALLAGQSALEDNFKINNPYRQGDLDWVSAQPKEKDTGFEKMSLGFKEGVLQAMDLVDSFGHQTKITFSHIEINPHLEAKAFLFKAPKGVDVIGE
ncbi:MAG: outer membrane lipoprotein chaperone LolA [Methylotenera sp.]|nr:outer membrane lipoprotein chaperone LolA [Methylotenera sp.]